MRTLRTRVWVASCLCALTACGGGGGDSGTGGGTTTPPTGTGPPTTTPSTPAITKAEAYRLLNQATFGATEAAAQQVIAQGYSAWIDAQLALPPTLQLPAVQAAYLALPQPVTNIGAAAQRPRRVMVRKLRAWT